LENSKQIFEAEKRKRKSADVITRLTSSTTTGYNFDVYTNDIKEKVKYIGTITNDHLGDSCTCHSFMYGNNENFVKENPLPFQCKHIMKAHEMMEGFWE
jgi:hypothetical protein